MGEAQGIAIHGSTGSIGTQVLDVIERLRGQCDFVTVALACNSNIEAMERQIHAYNPKYAAVSDVQKAEELRERVKGSRTEILAGEEAAAAVCGYEGVDIAVIGTAGFAGLAPTLVAIENGKRIATANKETFLAAGKLVMDAARKRGVEILPIDSEPSAMWQCLEPEVRLGDNGERHSVIWQMQHGAKHSIDHFILTGSGGPFLEDKALMRDATPAQALRHPKWNMGSMISIRSATMMNKGMERIEASMIFGVDLDMVKITIHPQSLAHSGVMLTDGSIKMQMSPTDMRYPILYALTFPERFDIGLPRLDLAVAGPLDFDKPDLSQFPALVIADRAGRLGGTAPAVLNGADEVVVGEYLRERIKLPDMVELVGLTLDAHSVIKEPSLAQIIEADRWARKEVSRLVEELVASRTPRAGRVRVV